MLLSVPGDIPAVTFTSFEDEETPTSNEKRPSTLVAVVKPTIFSEEDTESSGALSRLPSPMERSGSICQAADGQSLPVPEEFMDASENSIEESVIEETKVVSGLEAALRSKARLSSRLRSVPEKHSLVSFVQDIRRRGLEPDRRVSAAGLCTTTPIPNKANLEPADASTIVVKRRGISIHLHPWLFKASKTKYYRLSHLKRQNDV